MVDGMSIGLDFVKEIDKQWRKRLQSLDFLKEEGEKIDKIFIAKEPTDNKYLNYEDENSEWDYWDYWKKKYSIMR